MRIFHAICAASLVAAMASWAVSAANAQEACNACNTTIEGTTEEWRCLIDRMDSYVEDVGIADPTLILMTSPCDAEMYDGSKGWIEPDVGPGRESAPEAMRAYLLSSWQVNCLADKIEELAAGKVGETVSFDFSSCEESGDAD